MPLIASTVKDTIIRLGEPCIDDLTLLYDNKSKNKEKENLLTIYLNTEIGTNKITDLLKNNYLIQKNLLTYSAINSLFDHIIKNDLINVIKFEIGKGEIQNVAYQTLASPSIHKLTLFKLVNNKKMLMFNDKINVLDEIWASKIVIFSSIHDFNCFVNDTFDCIYQLIENKQLKTEALTQLVNNPKYATMFNNYHYMSLMGITKEPMITFENKVREVEKKYFESIMLCEPIKTNKKVKI